MANLLNPRATGRSPRMATSVSALVLTLGLLGGAYWASAASIQHYIQPSVYTRFIAPWGDDANDCSVALPCLTLQRVGTYLHPGDRVYARGGDYAVQAEQKMHHLSGSAEAPVLILAYPGEHPRFNASGSNFPPLDAVIKIESSEHVLLQGFEVCCSSGRGIAVSASEFVTISGNRVTQVANRGIGGNGVNITVEYNVIDRAVLSHADRDPNATWAAALGSDVHWDGTASRDWTIRGNTVTRSYGECIDVLTLIGFLVEYNFTDGCYSVDLYIDRSSWGLVRGNVFQSTIPGFERLGSDWSANGIMLAAEQGPLAVTPSYIVMTGNVVGPGVHYGFKWWQDPENNGTWNTYHHLDVTGNRVVGTTSTAVYFRSVGAESDPPCCSFFTGNLVEGEMVFDQPEAWTVSDNHDISPQRPLPSPR